MLYVVRSVEPWYPRINYWLKRERGRTYGDHVYVWSKKKEEAHPFESAVDAKKEVGRWKRTFGAGCCDYFIEPIEPGAGEEA